MVHMFNARFINDKVSKHLTVQSYLDELTFAMLAKAQESLVEHRHDGHASVERTHAKVDWYLVLSDERGQKAALSIEFGHGEYFRWVVPKRGAPYLVKVPATRPTYILTEAARIPKKQRRAKGKP
jgi:uncharacterized protein DUF5403